MLKNRWGRFMIWVHIAIVLALLEYLVFAMLVGRARMKYAIAAPAVTGNSTFERYFRVQQNTLEQLIVFVPAALLFARYASPIWAAVFGATYLLGRIIYAAGYIQAPEKRGPGAGLTFLSNIALVVGALWGLIRAALVS
jgi:uncharacterized membrane protein YecN with MAPEG domain